MVALSKQEQHSLIKGYSVAVTTGITSRMIFWTSFDPRWSGRAFAIDDRRLVTCEHVVNRHMQPKNIRFPDFPKLPKISRILHLPENGVDRDIAIIEFEAPHGLPIAPQAAANPAVSDAVMFSNRKSLFRSGVVHFYGNANTIWQALITGGIVDARALPKTLKRYMKYMETADTENHLYSNLAVYNGDSGSPVFNEHGELIGMAYATSKVTHQSILIPIELLRAYVAEMLDT